MIADLKPYPKMKDTGIPWLEEVPEHWEVRRAKTLFRAVDVRSESGAEELLTVSSNLGVVPRRSANVTMFKAESYAGHKLCWPGDLVINSLWAWSRGLGVSKHHGIVSTAYGVYRARDVAVLDPGFVHGLVRSTPFHWELRVRSKGVWTSRLQLTDESFFGAPFPLPPLPEQDAIVRFLDYMDRRIRRYIRAKQRLIKLLEEQKQAIIHQAVTGQIDVRTCLRQGSGRQAGKPYPAYKPSGAEWLGEVPEHWEVSRVKAEFTCLNSRRLPLNGSERGAMTSRLYDYYGASGVIDKVDGYIFDDELLLVAEDGANLVLRNLPLAIIARGRFWVNNHAHILKPRRGNLAYLAAVMETLNYRPWITGAAQPKLTKDRLLGIAIAVPPRAEQDEIIAAVNDATAALRVTIDRAHREIELLNEYRTRLIADVVTGKLDVREAAAALPDEPEETEFVDELLSGIDQEEEQDLQDEEDADG
jgi:type I restriction enzyme, S subunit